MSMITFDRLGHYPKQRELHADACDLGFGPGAEPFTMFDTMPGGPKAPGIVVRNRRTGNVARFLLAGRDRDDEGDIVSWRFTPHPVTLAEHPNLVGYTLIVFND